MIERVLCRICRYSPPRIQRGYSWRLSRPSLRRKRWSQWEDEPPPSGRAMVLNNGRSNVGHKSLWVFFFSSAQFVCYTDANQRHPFLSSFSSPFPPSFFSPSVAMSCSLGWNSLEASFIGCCKLSSERIAFSLFSTRCNPLTFHKVLWACRCLQILRALATRVDLYIAEFVFSQVHYKQDAFLLIFILTASNFEWHFFVIYRINTY